MGRNLGNGTSQSCGCLVKRHHPRTHGLTRSVEHVAWRAMKQRVKRPDYMRRGIKIDPRLANSFEAFLAEIGPRPGPGYSVDRIDNDGHYAPGNIRWATWRTQTRNKTSNVWVDFRGERMVLADAAEAAGIDVHRVITRIRRGWPASKALEMPLAARVKRGP